LADGTCDLPRTAKTLMADADVLPHISERVLGHAIQGVEGTYDQLKYETQKADALQRLAAQIELIIECEGRTLAQIENQTVIALA
jgi:hypothetical protein